MRPIYALAILLILNGCSFDNKSGIWKSENITDKSSDLFSEFETLSNENDNFDKVINFKNNFTLSLPKKINNKKWLEKNYNQFNNFDNFSYNSSRNLIFKGKRISRKILNNILHDGNNFILTDIKGNLIFYSINEDKVIYRFNFYKKKFKKLNKNLNIILDEDFAYITDNLGFIYAFNIKKQKIIWAKNVKVPFRSSLKIKGKLLIAADQNNNIYFFNKNDGAIIKSLPTEDSSIKNSFQNNFSFNRNFIFALNTYGSLYAFDDERYNVKWVVNLNQSLDINPNNLFNGNQIVSNDNFLVITSHESTYIINSLNGVIKNKFNIISQTKPLIVDNNLFLISANNLLICINLETGEIIYSYKINKKIADYLNIKEKEALFKSIMIANDKIFILLKNSYIIEFSISGEIEKIFKLPAKINSDLIFINNSIMYLSRNNKIIILG